MASELMLIVILLAYAVVQYECRLTQKQRECAVNKFDKPCQKHCTFQDPDEKSSDNIETPCCEISRCSHCWNHQDENACGSEVALIVKQSKELNDALFESSCDKSKKYPSFKCIYHFYTTLFYAVPLVILFVVVSFVVYCKIRKDHKTRKDTDKRDENNE
jgi:hypothetical protein